MKSDPKVQIFTKIVEVISSCETIQQINNAKNYLDLAMDNGYIEKELWRAIYFNIYLVKFTDIDNGDMAK